MEWKFWWLMVLCNVLLLIFYKFYGMVFLVFCEMGSYVMYRICWLLFVFCWCCCCGGCGVEEFFGRVENWIFWGGEMFCGGVWGVCCCCCWGGEMFVVGGGGENFFDSIVFGFCCCGVGGRNLIMGVILEMFCNIGFYIVFCCLCVFWR